LEKASQIIDRMGELDELVRPDGMALAGRIRLSAPTTLGITVIAKMLARFTELHPAVAVEMNLNDRQIDLINEGYDLAVRVAELAPSSLVARRIGTYDFVCCAAPGYLQQHGTPVSPADLASARCVINLNIVPRNQWPFRDANGAAQSVQVRGNLELDNGEAQRAAALAGAGIIFAPRALVAADLKNGGLVEVLADFGKFTLPIHTVHPSRNFVPKRVSALIDFLAREMKAKG
jgi:DNA-binding transcriptional LysR family regulator